MDKRQHGFSLLEVLLSIAIIGILAGASLPVYNAFAVRNDLDIATQQTASALRRAQVYARGVQGDSVWGVRVQPTTITLFKGSSFSGRDVAFDEVISLPASASVSGGLSEVRFAKLSGMPDATGDIALSSTANDTRTITLNAKGMVEY